MEINFKTPQTEFHNIYQGPYGLQTRNGFVTELRVEDIGIATPRNPASPGTSTKMIYGFSTESANSGQTFHYIFSQDANNNLISSLYDSQFTCRSSFTVGKMTANPEPFSVAINYNQIVVNSPSIPYPLWGFIGGSLVKANKVESINPDTPALTLFPGRVCSFADRFAWAYANQVIFNDPGTEPRTITAPNAISFGGTVLDLFQSGEGGNLIIVCTDATYSIPPDGLNGYQFQGVINRIPGYQGARSNNAATARGITVGAVKDGILDIGAFKKLPLNSYRIRRYFSQPVGPEASGDYRNAALLATDEGFVISYNGKTALYDIDTGMVTWYYIPPVVTWTGGDFEVIGILKDSDGKNIFITPINIIEMLGNVDYGDTITTAGDPTSTTIYANACFNIPSDPQMSPVIREITISCDRPTTVGTYIRGSNSVTAVPAPQNSIVVDISLWSATATLIEREMRSRRMQRAIRADSPDIELTFFGGSIRIGETIDVITKGIGKNRPTQ